MPPQQRPAPARHHTLVDGQQPKQVVNRLSQSSEQQRQDHQGIENRQTAVGLAGRCGDAAEREQDTGYVDIPRRIAWERFCSPGRKRLPLQVSSTTYKHAVVCAVCNTVLEHIVHDCIT